MIIKKGLTNSPNIERCWLLWKTKLMSFWTDCQSGIRKLANPLTESAPSQFEAYHHILAIRESLSSCCFFLFKYIFFLRITEMLMQSSDSHMLQSNTNNNQLNSMMKNMWAEEWVVMKTALTNIMDLLQSIYREQSST